LTAELHNDPRRLFGFHNIQDVFFCKGLKVKLVRGVIVGAYRFGVTVDHDALNALFLQGKGGLYTAIIEFNPLSDTIRPATQDHDLAFAGNTGLVLLFVVGVIIWRAGLEFGSTGVYELLDGLDSKLVSQGSDLVLIPIDEVGKLHIGESEGLALSQNLFMQWVAGL